MSTPNSSSETKSRLFNPLGFIPVAPLFSFVFPGILFALNAGRLHGTRSRRLLLLLFAATGGLLVLALFLFSSRVGQTSSLAFTGLNLAVGGLLYTLQAPYYRRYRLSGAKPRSFRS